MSSMSEVRDQFAAETARQFDDLITTAIGECFNIDKCDAADFIINNHCQKVINPDKSETFIINGVGVIRILPAVITFSDDGYTGNASTKYELLYKESNVIGE